jgi:pyruvate formate lyase activating enzyme
MNTVNEGYVFDIQRYTLHDGPGIRTEVFLQGCHLRCLWCHSPDSWQEKGELASFQVLCSGVDACGECLKACPTGALSPGPVTFSKLVKSDIAPIEIDRERCSQCGACAAACSNKALYFTARRLTVSEIMATIMKDEKYYRKTNGGVTLSGGEPMRQPQFARAILEACKDMGLPTALDTTGHAPWEEYAEILPLVDLFLFDVKHMDSDESLRVTGVRNERILENLARLARHGASIQIRVPTIPGINDSRDNLEATARYCASLGKAITRVQLLPYHKFGVPKYERLGKTYPLPDTRSPSRQDMEEHKAHFESHGLNVQIG